MPVTLIDRLADEVREWALARGSTVAVAESLTGGALSAALAKAGDAADWFAGGVVAYRNATKYRVLGVPEGPVVTADAARAMVRGVIELTGADCAIAVTGVGGPGAEEGHPAGTVFVCVATRSQSRDAEYAFDGDPDAVVEQTIEQALRLLLAM